MTIGNDLYLSGFTRQDKGENGAVFVRYETPQGSDRAPEITETPLYYGGKDTVNYTVSIPKPQKPRITGSAIIRRTSKSRYTAVVYDERRIEELKAETLNRLKKDIEEFFGKGTNVSRAR